MASIEHDNSSASRGVGVIMGDKRLKAIAVRGTKDLYCAKPAELYSICRQIAVDIADNPDAGDTTLNIGQIKGGYAPNVIADHAEAQVLIRLVTDSAPIRKLILEAAQGLAEVDFTLDLAFVRLRAIEGLPTMVAKFATDIPQLTNWGEPLLLGPGSIHVAHTPDDLANPKANEGNPGYLPEERAWMDGFIAAGYIDTFRSLHPEPKQYSWWSYRMAARAKNIGWRIDYFCTSPGLQGRIKEARIHPAVMGSDHCPVSLDLEF